VSRSRPLLFWLGVAVGALLLIAGSFWWFSRGDEPSVQLWRDGVMVMHTPSDARRVGSETVGMQIPSPGPMPLSGLELTRVEAHARPGESPDGRTWLILHQLDQETLIPFLTIQCCQYTFPADAFERLTVIDLGVEGSDTRMTSLEFDSENFQAQYIVDVGETRYRLAYHGPPVEHAAFEELLANMLVELGHERR
jgi:hypothetical protein